MCINIFNPQRQELDSENKKLKHDLTAMRQSLLGNAGAGAGAPGSPPYKVLMDQLNSSCEELEVRKEEVLILRSQLVSQKEAMQHKVGDMEGHTHTHTHTDMSKHATHTCTLTHAQTRIYAHSLTDIDIYTYIHTLETFSCLSTALSMLLTLQSLLSFSPSLSSLSCHAFLKDEKVLELC